MSRPEAGTILENPHGGRIRIGPAEGDADSVEGSRMFAATWVEAAPSAKYREALDYPLGEAVWLDERDLRSFTQVVP